MKTRPVIAFGIALIFGSIVFAQTSGPSCAFFPQDGRVHCGSGCSFFQQDGRVHCASAIGGSCAFFPQDGRVHCGYSCSFFPQDGRVHCANEGESSLVGSSLNHH